MATKKGLCPYCQPKRLDRRIFQVNPEASTCFCPHCMKEIVPSIAIEGYSNLIKKMLSIADNTLFVTCDPVLAYQQYADVIEFEPKEAHALLGRILCLVYMGRVRKSYLLEATTLLENTPYEGCDINEYVFFLKKINFALDEYETAVNKKLNFRGYYYDIECLKLYWVYLYEVIKLKELILDLVKEIKKRYSSQQNEALINLLEVSIEEKRDLLRADTYTTNGVGYRYVKMANGKACVEIIDTQIETHLSRFRLATLDEDDKTSRYIKDEVFKDYTHVVELEKVSLGVSIVLLLIAGGLIGAAYFLNQSSFWIFIMAACAVAVGAVVFFVLHIYWRLILKKRKLRIA